MSQRSLCNVVNSLIVSGAQGTDQASKQGTRSPIELFWTAKNQVQGKKIYNCQKSRFLSVNLFSMNLVQNDLCQSRTGQHLLLRRPQHKTLHLPPCRSIPVIRVSDVVKWWRLYLIITSHNAGLPQNYIKRPITEKKLQWKSWTKMCKSQHLHQEQWGSHSERHVMREHSRAEPHKWYKLGIVLLTLLYQESWFKMYYT